MHNPVRSMAKEMALSPLLNLRGTCRLRSCYCRLPHPRIRTWAPKSVK